MGRERKMSWVNIVEGNMLKVICLGSYVRDYMPGVISRGSNVEGHMSRVICRGSYLRGDMSRGSNVETTELM